MSNELILVALLGITFFVIGMYGCYKLILKLVAQERSKNATVKKIVITQSYSETGFTYKKTHRPSAIGQNLYAIKDNKGLLML